jgi:hypothetical protein
VVITALLNKWVTDTQARSQLEDALDHSLGAIQQAATLGIKSAAPQIAVAGITPQMSTGIQYVLDHAGAEAKRFGITPAMLADKITARIGLANIATNQATAASNAPSPLPLAPLLSVSAQLATLPTPSIPRV